jgi:putative ABC transport system permease protein
MLYVKDEVSFDRFHKNVNNIYQIMSKAKHSGNEYKNSNTGFLQGPGFKQNVPGIQSFVRVEGGEEDIQTGTEIHSQEVLYVDSSFFSVFTFSLLGGNPKTCLMESYKSSSGKSGEEFKNGMKKLLIIVK